MRGRYEGSSDLVNLRYHMGPISDSSSPSPSVSEWWSTVSLYADQTGANVTRSLTIGGESTNLSLSCGTSLTRLSIQQVISDSIRSGLPADHRNGVYLILTVVGVDVQDFDIKLQVTIKSLLKNPFRYRELAHLLKNSISVYGLRQIEVPLCLWTWTDRAPFADEYWPKSTKSRRTKRGVIRGREIESLRV
ncbi:hypothetical protein MA16_Dca014611 [Dendrobium catenatum]|uniref:Uncharacterized protein n=1 Tax=Dendrobium catenatum TaxID=906689 RepID=A0A2I0WYP1_9ASPA|nr:hypothetical protein MA16_Dca014611 [Dendrobium catenatum]